ncbi:MAG: Gfo/Idh/MocA family protein [Opitutales bacterium]
MTPYTIGLVGLGSISRAHRKAISATETVELTAVCDTDAERLATAELDPSVARHTSLEAMMAAGVPDIVCILTANSSHAALTTQVARHGPRAIICEKPMATHYPDAVAMVEACEAAGVELLVNHQRRLGAGAFGRRVIADGLIGDLFEIRAACSGDFLSDGTHIVDLLLALTGDEPVERVWGSVFFTPHEGQVRRRYGHAVDFGATCTWYTKADARCEIRTGEMAQRMPYASLHVRGSQGELWHPGGKTQPSWFLNDGTPGTHQATFDDDRWYLLPREVAQGGAWRCLNPEAARSDMAVSLQSLCQRLDGDATPHPLNGRAALRVQEILHATFLSARHHEGVSLPLPADVPNVTDELLAQTATLTQRK